jgi:hypothetical protein
MVGCLRGLKLLAEAHDVKAPRSLARFVLLLRAVGGPDPAQAEIFTKTETGEPAVRCRLVDVGLDLSILQVFLQAAMGGVAEPVLWIMIRKCPELGM